MSNFFKNFPLIQYRFGDETSPVLFQNLTTYVDVFEQVVNQGSFYEDYYIQEGERPDTLSYKFYGTTDYYWTIYLANPKLLEKGWPLDNQRFHDYKDKMFPNLTSTIAYNPFPRTLEQTRMVFTPSVNVDFYLTNKNALINYFPIGSIGGSSIQFTVAGFPTFEGFYIEIKSVDYNTGRVSFSPLAGIFHVKIEDGGSGYDVAPTLTVEGLGTGAELTATVNTNGAISAVVINKAGYGYEEPWDRTGTYVTTPQVITDPSFGVPYTGFSSYYIPNFKDPVPRPTIKITRNSTTSGRDAVLTAYVFPSYFWMNNNFKQPTTFSGMGRYNLTKEDYIYDNEADFRFGDEDSDQPNLFFATKRGTTLEYQSLFEYRDSNDVPIDFNIFENDLEWYQDSANEDQLTLSPRFRGAYGYYVEPGTPITLIEKLEEINDDQRKIRMLKPNVVAQVAYEFNRVLKETTL